MIKLKKNQTYLLTSDNQPSIEVVCNQIYTNKSVSLFYYKKKTNTTPSKRFKMLSNGTIKGFINPFLESIIEGSKVSCVSNLEKNKQLTKLVLDSWKSAKIASGYYRGMANVNINDNYYKELIFLSTIRKHIT